MEPYFQSDSEPITVAFSKPDREPDGVANSVTYGVANSVAYSVTFVSSANDRSFDLAVSVTVSVTDLG